VRSPTKREALYKLEDTKYTDVEVSVAFKAIAGKRDEGDV
jgi:hypothetical protein